MGKANKESSILFFAALLTRYASNPTFTDAAVGVSGLVRASATPTTIKEKGDGATEGVHTPSPS